MSHIIPGAVMISKKRTTEAIRVKSTTLPDPVTDMILDALEERRQAVGISLVDLARQSGVGYQYVQRLLRARHLEEHRHSPTLDKLAPIARALGMRLKLVRDR